ncbi:cold-inducible RNA-binding protein-like [Camellia sinensis]|uniref:cold-inducible RNA-binding protein-like n=1 Tax=Camellia sinensis TaxID=4442 RepID=UPI0010356A5E|nr:cold-inducible RNA-binding protein-like [Camellia sinensis]
MFFYEFKNFFSKYGKVVEHEIIRDNVTKRSRGFGFVVFDNEQVVDTILANGNMIDMEGSQMREQKRAALLKEKRASSGLTIPPRVIVKRINFTEGKI